MFCIAAFIVLVILSVFSAKYRRLAKKAWGCVGRRVTFRPCDTTFKQDLKDKLLAKVAIKTPRLLKTADIALEVAAFLVVILTVWSVYVVAKSGLNLYVYGTCNPANSASCSLGAEACSIESARPAFWSSLRNFELHKWAGAEFSELTNAVTAIPTRMQKWDASAYLPANASYLTSNNPSRGTSVEVIDPGCRYCMQLYKNIKESGFADRYNLTYIAFPIADTKDPNKYRFPNSYLVTQYLEALRLKPLEGAETPADWQVLDRIFTKQNESNISYQLLINGVLNKDETTKLLNVWLTEIGYSEEQITEINKMSQSDQVKGIIEVNQKTVRERIKTVKIPTIIFDGRRHDGVLETDKLR